MTQTHERDNEPEAEAIDRSHLVRRLKPQRLLRGIGQALGLLSSSERMRALRLVLSMNVNALLGLVGLSSIVPFIHLMLSADPLGGDDTMARVLRRVGFTQVDDALVGVGLLAITLILIKNLYTLFHTGWINRLSADAELRLSSDLLRRIIAAPYDWLATQNNVVLREVAIGQAGEWARSTIRTLLQLASDTVFLVFTVALIIAISPVTGLVAAVVAIALAILLVGFCRHFIVTYGERKRVSGRLGVVAATEAIFGGRDVRMSQQISDVLANAHVHHLQSFGIADVRGRQWQVVPNLGLEVVGTSLLVVISLGAIWLGAARADVAALLTLYAVIAIRAIPMAAKLVTSVALIANSLPAVAELRDFVDKLPLPQQPDEAAQERLADWHRLTLEKVSYRYPGAVAQALGPIDLELNRGTCLGIVGASGSGKSTLIDVMVGLLRPAGGAMAVDGCELDDAGRFAWRAHIGYVVQAPFMLDGSMAENIEFGMPRSGDHETRCREAAETAGLGELIASLPGGLATPLGDRGVKLSGGQRQRVAIARALYRAANLLVFDEATSALDSITEREITKSIAELHGKITTVIVAHRLSTVIHADKIIVLDKGRVTAAGTHAQLLDQSSVYRRLIEAQSIEADQKIQ